MILNINQKGEKYLVNVVCTRLTLASSEELKERVKPILSTPGVEVTVDLSGVKFIDSSGAGSLIALAKQAKIAGSTFYITNLEDGVKELFTLLRLETVFNLINSDK